MQAAKNIIIVGGHGKVSLRLARLLSPKHSVTSVIRDAAHESDICETNAKPLILSLEDSPVADFTKAFTGFDIVYFSAGAGGKGGAERTKKVDYEGALKIFDAIEAVKDVKPRLILVSCIDSRNREKPVPGHYNEADIAKSDSMWTTIGTYMKWKYEADKNLAKRDVFRWTILRPGGLTDSAGTGKAAIGRTHLTESISRDDVAEALAHLADREDAAGLAIDLVGGDVPIAEGLDKVIKRGETDFLG
ncbi:NADH(P)-binding-domain-containing protein [Mycena floridula]|nr:NADH(P)-binding-domain-containing protein [Mycena floridula]